MIVKELNENEVESYRLGRSVRMVHSFLQGSSVWLYNQMPDSAYVRCLFTDVTDGFSGQLELPVFKWVY